MINKREKIIEALLLIAGNAILAFSVSFFIIPNNILSGGVAGVAIAINPFIDIEVTTLMNIIIGVTFVMGYVFLGKKFALKTVASSILYPIFIELFTRMDYISTVDPILASIFGGALSGLALALTFKTGASTGGMDIPPLILEKLTRIKVSVWIMVVDAITVLLGLMNFSLNDVLIGLVSVYAATTILDKISVIGGQQARQVTIISEFYEEILKHLHFEISRGSTLLQARGGYTLREKEIIMTVISRSEYYDLERTVLDIDPEAFLIVSNVTEVHGLGFRTL